LNGEIRLGRSHAGTVEVQMAGADPQTRAPRRSRVSERLTALLALLACVFGLLVYLVSGGSSRSDTSASSCPSASSPEVVSVNPSALGPLRASVARVLPGRIGRLYEEGPVVSGAAWSDDLPLAPALSPTALRPASYEMRWWSPNRDDIVADVFVFADAATAQRFSERALSTRCRRSGSEAPSGHLAQAGNLTWSNPEGFVQADVYLTRGNRVYRVAAVPAVAKGHSLSARRLGRAFYTIDALACLIPQAGCGLANRSSPI